VAANTDKRNCLEERLRFKIRTKVRILGYKLLTLKVIFSWKFFCLSSEDQLSSEMKDYLEHTYNIVSTSLDRDLFVKQTKSAKVINDIKNDPKIKLNEKEKETVSTALSEYKGKNNLREILKYERNLKFLGGE
jgi:hypothetical protein